MENLLRYKNVEYFMPFLFCNDIFIFILQELLKNEFNPVKYVYGSTYCAWSGGGRHNNFRLKNLNQISNYLKQLKSYNIIPTFTFTNININREKLNDEFSNNLLDIAYEQDAHFIVATDELYTHIKQRYPNAKMHCSVIMPSIKRIEDNQFNETKFYNEMLDKYDIVVIRPEYTMENIDQLNKLIIDISRVEVLINQYCQYNCPFHKEHYMFISQIDNWAFNKVPMEKNENYSYNNSLVETFSLCPKNKIDKKNFRSVALNHEQIQKIIEIGITKLKIQGRSYNFDDLFNELYKYFFNNDNSESDVRDCIDKICAKMIQINKRAALIYPYICMQN